MIVLNKSWCEEPYTGSTPHKFSWESRNDLYAIDQITINGHMLYAKNDQFRDAYKKEFNKDMLIPDNNLIDFLYGNKFNLLYFGLLAAPYLIGKGNTPSEYIERCSPGNNPELSKFCADETIRVHKPVRPAPGMPWYYYTTKHSKVFRNYTTGEMQSICTAKELLTKAIEYAKLLNADAQIAVAEMVKNKDPEINQFLEALKDESWSPYLYAAR